VVLLLQRDDDRAMYAEFFRHHDVESLCPADTAEAFQLAPQADIIVTELIVPTVNDGVAFIERLRADLTTKSIPIVVVTSWAWQTERLRAQDAGCDLFLTKPCLPDVLLSEIRRVLAVGTVREVRATAAKASTSHSRKRRPSQ
jgi:CheY-like chemotaxis protein